MQDTYALLGTVALAFCNRVGNEEGLTFWGGSRIVAADGSTVAQAPLWEEALVVGTLETDDLRMQRYGLPLLADERLELVRRELDRIICRARRARRHSSRGLRFAVAATAAAAAARDRAAQAIEVIIGFIRAQMAQTGFSRLVVGLSGGVDSATVAFLAARAVGPDDLLAVRMPYRTSSDASETDALRVVEALGCRTERVEITPMVEPMLELDRRRGRGVARTCGAGTSWPASG